MLTASEQLVVLDHFKSTHLPEGVNGFDFAQVVARVRLDEPGEAERMVNLRDSIDELVGAETVKVNDLTDTLRDTGIELAELQDMVKALLLTVIHAPAGMATHVERSYEFKQLRDTLGVFR